MPESSNRLLERVSYLSFDSLAEGVGASQVGRYVTRLADTGVGVDLHTFEKKSVLGMDDVFPANVRWHVHRFGGYGSFAGAGRVLRGAAAVRGRPFVHARGDVPALSAVLGRPHRWIWDMRSFWRDERLSMGMMARNSLEDRLVRWGERAAAREADAIIVLAATAIPVIAERHGSDAAAKAHVITTCADLDLFSWSPRFPEPVPIKLLLPGSLNDYYDVSSMLSLVGRIEAHTKAQLSVVSPTRPPWHEDVGDVPSRFFSAMPEEVPAIVAAHHATLCICKFDSGVSLRARMPIKLGESLAVGRPVVVNAGLGDMDEIITRHGCGVVVSDPSQEALTRAAHNLIELIHDDETPRRCRAAAEEHFDLDRGVEKLLTIYREVRAKA